MAPSILSLPAELCCEIASCLDKEDICSLRLSCKHLYTAATKALFSFVRLYPREYSVDLYRSILEDPEFKQYPRHVELNTLYNDEEDDSDPEDSDPEDSDPEDSDSDEEEGVASNFLQRTSKKYPWLGWFPFPNMTSVTLRFSENGTSGNGFDYGYFKDEWTQWQQTYRFRQSVLQKFFRTLADPSASKVNDICIDNIQNMNDTSFMRSETAVEVLSRLKALRLYITPEDYTASPEQNLEMEELHTYMEQLPSCWLQPAANNLTTLCLYHMNIYFGYSPKLDLRGVHFPSLRTLALGNYTFTHDWQLDWLSSHSSTLENLYLDDCIVVYYAKLYDCKVDSEGYPIVRHGGNTDLLGPRVFGSYESRFIDLTWARILHHLRAHLTSLRHFRIGKSTRWGRCGPARNVFEYEDLAIGLLPDRYQVFDMGIGPCQYTDDSNFYYHEDLKQGDTEGQKAVAFFEKREEQNLEDRGALVELLTAIRQPLPKETHIGKVIN